MAEQLLIVCMAGRRVAIAASEVEAVVELEQITPAPRALGHVAGLATLRSRVLTVVDSSLSLGMGPTEPVGPREAIVIPAGGHTYALLVEAVEDVVEVPVGAGPVGAPVGGGWDHVAAGMVEVEDTLLLMVDPHRLIAGPSALAA